MKKVLVMFGIVFLLSCKQPKDKITIDGDWVTFRSIESVCFNRKMKVMAIITSNDDTTKVKILKNLLDLEMQGSCLTEKCNYKLNIL